MAIGLPQSLRKLATHVVNSVILKSLQSPDRKPIQDWFEDEGWDEVVMSLYYPLRRGWERSISFKDRKPRL